MARQYPDTFEIPSDEEIKKLKVGDLVKLIFFERTTKQYFDEESYKWKTSTEDGSGERMWIIITGIDDDGYFHGILDNEPVVVVSIKLGDTVTFKTNNIIDILTKEERKSLCQIN